MVYLAGDNDLSSAANIDLKEMRTVGSTNDVNIIAQVDRTTGLDSMRYCIQCSGKEEKTVHLGQMDSGDPKTVTDFISWTAANYRAERYALILWNHGGGWAPSEIDHIAKEAGTPNYSAREGTERSTTPLARTLFRTSLKTILSLSSPAERAICSDDGSGHSLDTGELGHVLEEAVETLGQPLDVLGMDACLMNNLEVAYQVQHYAKYMIASEENEPNNGWPYDVVLRKLTEDADLPTAQLVEYIVHAVIKSYVDIDYEAPVTQAACDLSKIADVVEPLDKLADMLATHLPEMTDEIWKAQKKAARFCHNTLWDISDFCGELAKGTSHDSVKRMAEDVQTALQRGPGRFVIAESHSGNSVKNCGGTTIYFVPPGVSSISQYYADLDYTHKHRWLPFLKAYHATG